MAKDQASVSKAEATLGKLAISNELAIVVSKRIELRSSLAAHHPSAQIAQRKMVGVPKVFELWGGILLSFLSIGPRA